MTPARPLGGQRFQPLADLAAATGCAWRLVRREPDGARCLLQVWEPRPPDRTLDALKAACLSGPGEGREADPPRTGFGFDAHRAWFLQELAGTPLARVWPAWGPERRRDFQARLAEALKAAGPDRLLAPEAIGLLPGRILLPRTLGPAPWRLQDLWARLHEGPEGEDGGDGDSLAPWEQPRDLAGGLPLPLRGRARELTYLKSLVLGFSAPAPGERILVLQGEEGLGKGRLARACALAAETDGRWVHALEVRHGEAPGALFNRILQALLEGFEAEFYSHRPDLARALSRRLASFAFLAGGRAPADREAAPDGTELEAAGAVAAFAAGLRPRLVQLSDLDRAGVGALDLVARLARDTDLPWLLSLTAGPADPRSRALLGPLRDHPALALVHLDRLEGPDLRQVLADLLGPEALPEAFKDGLARASLGNPGLLQSLLELAAEAGEVLWAEGAWRSGTPRPVVPRAPEDLVRQLLPGRLQRLRPAAAALVRMAAAAEQDLPVATLGSALGLAGEPLEEALQNAVASRLVEVREGAVALADPRLGDLVRSHTPGPELKRLARALLGALGRSAEAGPPPVRLRALAADPATALAQVLAFVEADPPLAPAAARRLVEEALALDPAPSQAARLLEFRAARGGGEGARADLDAALALVPPAPATAAFRARLLGLGAQLDLDGRRPREAGAALAEAEALGVGGPGLVRGRLLRFLGRGGEAVTVLEQALAGLEPTPAGRWTQATLLLELGRALAGAGRVQRAQEALQTALNLLEHGPERTGLAAAQVEMARLRLHLGRPAEAESQVRAALRTARAQGEPEAPAHLVLGVVHAARQEAGPALAHLERARDGFLRQGDAAAAALADLRRARVLAGLGEAGAARSAAAPALALPAEVLSAGERIDREFLAGEIEDDLEDGPRARNAFARAAALAREAGLAGRERLARLRRIQVQAEAPGADLGEAWADLEALKGPVEGSGSRSLDLAWNQAHALLLDRSAADGVETAAAEALAAWGSVQASARELGRPATVLAAGTRISALLAGRGERLGARSRMEEALRAFHDLWAQVPPAHGPALLASPRLRRFRAAVAEAGLSFDPPPAGGTLSEEPARAGFPTLLLRLPLDG